MDRPSDQKTASQYLYPRIDPFDQRMLDVGDGHRIYVEQCGNPEGVPVVVLHGGPGGTSCAAQLLFPLADERAVIRYDQLGSGRSGRPTDTTLWQRDRFVEALRRVCSAIVLWKRCTPCAPNWDWSACTCRAIAGVGRWQPITCWKKAGRASCR